MERYCVLLHIKSHLSKTFFKTKSLGMSAKLRFQNENIKNIAYSIAITKRLIGDRQKDFVPD